MNQENQKKVLDYLSGDYVDSQEPLVFHNYATTKEEFDITKFTIEQIVVRTLELINKYPSYSTETGDFECSSGRFRSSLDIWRHIKYYYPKVMIFDVMRALYNLNHEGTIYGHFCCDIHRRVFRLEKSTRGDYFQIEMRAYSGRNFDEYGLVWNDWKEI